MLVSYYLALRMMNESPFNVVKKHRPTLLFRGIVGVCSNALAITSLKLITMTKAAVIYWTAPIFTAIFAHIHLHERIAPFDWVACFMAFFGILIM